MASSSDININLNFQNNIKDAVGGIKVGLDQIKDALTSLDKVRFLEDALQKVQSGISVDMTAIKEMQASVQAADAKMTFETAIASLERLNKNLADGLILYPGSMEAAQKAVEVASGDYGRALVRQIEATKGAVQEELVQLKVIQDITGALANVSPEARKYADELTKVAQSHIFAKQAIEQVNTAMLHHKGMIGEGGTAWERFKEIQDAAKIALNSGKISLEQFNAQIAVAREEYVQYTNAAGGGTAAQQIFNDKIRDANALLPQNYQSIGKTSEGQKMYAQLAQESATKALAFATALAAIGAAALKAGQELSNLNNQLQAGAQSTMQSYMIINGAIERSGDTSDATKEKVRESLEQYRKYGKTIEEQAAPFAKLVSMYGSVEEAVRINDLAMRLSSSYGIEYSRVVNVLSQAENGRLLGLQQLGIKTKDLVADTTLKANREKDLVDLQRKSGLEEELANRGWENTKKLSKAEKEKSELFILDYNNETEAIKAKITSSEKELSVHALINKLDKETPEMKTAQSTSQQMQEDAMAQFKDVQDQIGQAQKDLINPIMVEIWTQVRDILKSVKEFFASDAGKGVLDFVGGLMLVGAELLKIIGMVLIGIGIFKGVPAALLWIPRILPWTATIIGVIPVIGTAITGALGAIATGFGAVVAAASPILVPILLVIAAIAVVVVIIWLIASNWDAICKFITEVTQNIANWFMDTIWNPIVKWASDWASWIDDNIIQPLVNSKNPIIQALIAPILWVWNTVLKPFFEWITDTWNKLFPDKKINIEGTKLGEAAIATKPITAAEKSALNSSYNSDMANSQLIQAQGRIMLGTETEADKKLIAADEKEKEKTAAKQNAAVVDPLETIKAEAEAQTKSVSQSADSLDALTTSQVTEAKSTSSLWDSLINLQTEQLTLANKGFFVIDQMGLDVEYIVKDILMKEIKEARAASGAATSGQGVNITINGMVIREESDIKKTAQELYNLQRRKQLAQGVSG